MKDITRITLASLPYNVELAARKELEHYCTAIERSLQADDDAMREIEVRMTELLAERGVSGEKVISAPDVAALREQLGEPEDFAEDGQAPNEPHNDEVAEDKPDKRLMRDMGNRLLGGVCAGIAAYFKTDPVLVRVVTVILLFLTAGTIIPLYLLMWLIIPPARTASERLAMAGRPVTLAAIQQESATPVASREPALLAFFRYAVAGLLLTGIVASGILIVRSYPADFFSYLSMQAPWAIALTLAFMLSGILFMAMLGLLAYAVLAKKFTKKMGIALIIIMLAGVGGFGAGVLGLHSDYGQSMTQMSAQHRVETTLDATALIDAKQLIIDAPDNQLYVNYTTATGNPQAKLSYDRRNMTNNPSVTLTKNGDVVTLKADTQSNGCIGGTCMPTFLEISGPVLQTITSANADLSYRTDGQAALTLGLSGDSVATVYGDRGQIDEASITVRDTALASLNFASVKAVKAELSESGRVVAGNLARLVLTAPEVCSTTARPSALYASSDTVTLNGRPVGSQDTLKCFSLEQVDGQPLSQ